MRDSREAVLLEVQAVDRLSAPLTSEKLPRVRAYAGPL